MRLILSIVCCITLWVLGTQAGYERGFANGTSEAYSHIDDTQSRCK